MLNDIFKKMAEEAEKKAAESKALDVTDIDTFFDSLTSIPKTNGREFSSRCYGLSPDKKDTYTFAMMLIQDFDTKTDPVIKLGVGEDGNISVTTYNKKFGFWTGGYKYKQQTSDTYTDIDQALAKVAEWAIETAPDLVRKLPVSKTKEAPKPPLEHPQNNNEQEQPKPSVLKRLQQSSPANKR